MNEADANPPKLLFVISNDFGELSGALYFTLGGTFDVTLALPPRLFALHAEHLPIAAFPYQTIQDVLALADRDRPDVVLLFSGYLFAANNLFSLEALRMLVRQFRERGVRIVTSDPFLGLMAYPNASVFSDEHPKKALLLEHFRSVAETMRGIVHLYPADVRTALSHAGHSFFNEHVVLTAAERAEFEARLGRRLSLRPGRKRWMFVLSAEDYGLQIGLHGRQAFDDLLLGKIQETARAGRQPILVAPKVCIDSVARAAGTVDSAIFLPFCQYDLFQMLVLEAEYLFYWNVFSYSILARVANGFPVLVFDSGHIARAVPPLHRLGLQTYYLNAPIPYVEPARELDERALAALADAQKCPLAQSIAALRKLPAPAQVIREILI